MTDRTPEQPFAEKKFRDVHGHRMAYIDEGEGPAIVFQHGNPTSSYLWRNVMPHLVGHGRLIACDLMGMGDSAKLDPAMGPGRYGFEEQRRYLDGLLDALDLGDDVTLVLHDTGSMLGFDWANRHRDRVRGIAYMEAIVMPLTATDFPPYVQEMLKTVTPEIMEAGLQRNDFVEGFLLGTRDFSPAERAHYLAPFENPGEDRRPTISFDLPIDGRPDHTAKIVGDYAAWLSTSEVPKLLIRADPGYLLKGRLYDFARIWPNQTEVTVPGTHYIQETSPDAVGRAIAEFVRGLEATSG